MKTMYQKLAIAFLLMFLSTTVYAQESYKIPSEDWVLEIDLEDFKVLQKGFSSDSTAFQLMAEGKNGSQFTLSIFIEKAVEQGDKEKCRDYYWTKAAKSPLEKEHLKKYETKDLAIVEHDTKKYNGQKIDYHSMNAYLSHQGYWVDVHISKIAYSKKDKALFDKICASISIALKA